MYATIKRWMQINLYLYFAKIEMHGLSNVPKNKPVLFLPNHQSALLDVLLIAVDCNRKPWFLTRSDVFKKKFFQILFEFFQMIPIYRIRDGREALRNNQAVFDRCASLLQKNEAVLMFPEANHNLKRRVRPLSKGFTRILFNTLEKYPDTDIQIIPVGLNYKNAVNFPDKVALYFGTPIAVRKWYMPNHEKQAVENLKKVVSDQLKQLTTHIEDEQNYNQIIKVLQTNNFDFLNPSKVNLQLTNLDEIKPQKRRNIQGHVLKLAKGLFLIVNLPLVFIWRMFFKPKVWEPEFMGTLRFAFVVIAYPLYYAFLFFLVCFCTNMITALVLILGLFTFNLVYVKCS